MTCRLPASKLENIAEQRGHLEKLPFPKQFGPIDQKKPSCEQKQEHIIEPGHYYGISR